MTLGLIGSTSSASRTVEKLIASISGVFIFESQTVFLFELATEGPGFATDEPVETMGERLALPPFLEPRRAKIEKGLKLL